MFFCVAENVLDLRSSKNELVKCDGVATSTWVKQEYIPVEKNIEISSDEKQNSELIIS